MDTAQILQNVLRKQRRIHRIHRIQLWKKLRIAGLVKFESCGYRGYGGYKRRFAQCVKV
jgi:hypothetical protein